jgi:hypothetical protein
MLIIENFDIRLGLVLVVALSKELLSESSHHILAMESSGSGAE